MQGYKVGFGSYELNSFKKKADEYLNIDENKKTMSEFYEYMGITRHTLSKYKKRNSEWHNAINEIKGIMTLYNILLEYKEKLHNTLEKIEEQEKRTNERNRKSAADHFRDIGNETLEAIKERHKAHSRGYRY